MITASEFARLQALIERESGVYLDPGKKTLLVGRLAGRLRALELESFGAYYLHVLNDEAELVELIDRVCTNETSFFREPLQFEFLAERVFPKWLARAEAGRRKRRIRAWSAGCSTGEEPYSLAMTLLEHFRPAQSWEIEIHATDVSTAALKHARSAIWPREQAERIPSALLKRFMLRGIGAQEGMMKASPEIRSLTRFSHLNLVDQNYDIRGLFDLILCRNVLIYFGLASRLRVTHGLLDYLARDGFLLLGHAESLTGVTDRVSCVVPTVYQLAKGAAAGDRRWSGGGRGPGTSAGRGVRQ